MVRAKPDGEVELADGPYAEGKEHIGGIYIIVAGEVECVHRARPVGGPRGCVGGALLA